MLQVCASRGDLVESTHAVSVAVVDRDGKQVAWSGDPGIATFMRSAAKPFQAIPLVEDGVTDRFAVTSEEMALICASHSSEPEQVAAIRRLLTRVGCEEASLVCGPHAPLAFGFAVRPEGMARPEELIPRTSVSSNCSGKHAGMLALARHHGWPSDGYEQSDHPVQQRCRAVVSAWADVPADAIGEAVDGCGVVSFRVPLHAMALAYARLGTSAADAPRTVRTAMMRHPELVGGAYRLCTEAMRAYPGQVLAKVGAAGVYGAALPELGLGIGIKVHDGDARATMVALVAVMTQLGLEPAPRTTLARFAEFPILNTLRRRVGTLRAAGQLAFR